MQFGAYSTDQFCEEKKLLPLDEMVNTIELKIKLKNLKHLESDLFYFELGRRVNI